MERIPLYFRCYAKKRSKKGKIVPKPTLNSAKSIVVVIDTETTTDKFQNLIFGTCGVWINGKLSKFFLFYDDGISNVDKQKIIDSSKGLKCTILSREKFVDDVFYPLVYKARAKCIGFNLPFDLSRLGTYYGKSRKMHNGVSIKLSNSQLNPRIIIKRLDSKSSFIEFTGAVRKNSEKKNPLYKGYFVDLKTFTFSLTNESYSLKNALKDFKCPLQKIDAEQHGIINREYVGYNINDTLATHHLYLKALEMFSKYSLNTKENRLFSPASIGKEYLKKIGIRSFTENNPDFTKELLGKIMMTYYGGRTEVRIRKTPVKVSYIDFTSMYPTVYVLLQMHKMLTAKKIVHMDALQDAQKLLDTVTKQDVAKPEFWHDLTIICKIAPNEDILPARAKYQGQDTTNIGINYLNSTDKTDLWYALPDLISSKFLSGKIPKISEAILLKPEGMQNGLQEIEVLKGIAVKPEEDFIRTLIKKRIQIKNNPSQDKRQSKLLQNILKIIANSASYGIFIQQDVMHHIEKMLVDVYGLDNFTTEQEKTEKIGSFFNPAMSVFLTAGARLVLATAESLVLENKGYVAYCDTDSLFVSPDHVKLVQEFFSGLNPYDEIVEMFKIEDEKDILLDNVWCFAISAKRYVLYNYDKEKNEFTILKYSAHGLGHIENINEVQWWKDILKMQYFPEQKEKILEQYKDKVCISSYNVSNYNLLTRFDALNKGKPFSKTVKPFNFFSIGTKYRQDLETNEPVIPCLPKVPKDEYGTIQYMPFVDYRSGKSYPNRVSLDTKFYWKPLNVVLEEFCDHKEAKSEDGEGFLQRRHLEVDKSMIRYIGKETNELEESLTLGVFKTNWIEYVNSQKKIEKIIANLTEKRSVELGISRRMYYYLKKKSRNKEKVILHPNTIRKISQVSPYC